VPLARGSPAEVALRASGVVACEALARLWNAAHPPDAATGLPARLTANVLANFLWGRLGKRADYRPFPRHHTPDTLFY